MNQISYEYLSDNALESLILETESSPLLQAPAHLKNEIMEKAAQSELLLRRKKIHALRIYRIKVSFATAAAIVLLCFVPNILNHQVLAVKSSFVVSNKIIDELNHSSNEICSRIFDFSKNLARIPKTKFSLKKITERSYSNEI